MFDPFGGGGFSFMFNLFPIIFGIIFILIIGTILFSVVKGIKQWNKNENSPRLSVPAIVKIKRTDVSRHAHNHGNGHTHHSTSTHYYVTFEFESGDRSEFKVSGKEYGMLAENDFGILSFQGTRYLDFERKNIEYPNGSSQ